MRAPLLVKPLTEAEFLAQVLALAHLCGWRSFHARPGRTATSWRTAVQGDGRGFPDLVLLKGARILVAELKVGNNKPSPQQRAWLRAFRDVGVRAEVWYPRNWSEIEMALSGD